MMPNRRALLSAAALAWMAGPVWASETADEAAILAWLRSAARPFGPDLVDGARALAQALPGRVFGLGEATHGSHEDHAFKAALILELAQAGRIDTLFLESNRRSGEVLDAYVGGAGGDVAEAMRAGGLFRIWRAEEMGGLLTGLRDLAGSGGPRIRVVAVDCQAPDIDLAAALDGLASRDPERTAGLRARLVAVAPDFPTPRRAGELAGRLSPDGMVQALSAARELEAVLAELAQGDASMAEAAYAARTGRQGLEAFEYETTPASPAAQTGDYYTRRDRFMAENLIHRARGRTGGALWAHNTHVAAEPVTFGGQTYTPQGAVLRGHFGREYVSVLFEYGRARFNAVPQTGAAPSANAAYEVMTRTAGAASPGALLGQVGPDRFWLPLTDGAETSERQAFRARPFSIDWPGWTTTPEPEPGPALAFAGIADILVFIRELSPALRYAEAS